MGVVYHAIDPNIGRPVAIKTIRLGDGRTPEEQARLRERLLREARARHVVASDDAVEQLAICQRCRRPAGHLMDLSRLSAFVSRLTSPRSSGWANGDFNYAGRSIRR